MRAWPLSTAFHCSQTYLETGSPVSYVKHQLFDEGTAQGIRLTVQMNGETHVVTGEGNGPIDAAVHALRKLDITLQVRSYEERSMGSSREGCDAKACAFMEVMQAGNEGECYGVGMDANIVTASIKALMSGVNRINIAARNVKAA